MLLSVQGKTKKMVVFFGNDASKLRLLDFSLRLLVAPFTVASICIAVTNREDNADYGNLGFKNFVGLKYMVFISALASAYALFAALSSCLNFLVTKPWLFFAIDQVLAYLMVTSMAAFSEFLYLAYRGDRVVSWSQACVSYGKFCNRLIYALSLHAVAVCCFLVLAMISAYRVFKRFEPPFVNTSSKECNQETKT